MTQISEITTLAELLEKVEEYKVTTSHLRISHPWIDEISGEIPDLPRDLVYQLAAEEGRFPYNRGSSWVYIFSFEGGNVHAVSVPVE